MSILFAFPGYEKFSKLVKDRNDFELGDLSVKHFPDGESLVTIKSDVKNKDIIVVCGLDRPDAKMMPLLFFARTAKELGAKKITLVAPYLSYMRQDKQFEAGQAVTSKIFAVFLSQLFDSLITLDPHLHRYKSLEEIYSIPTTVLHAAGVVGDWIKKNVKNPVLIGPDEESLQWVEGVAKHAGAPFIVLKKVRHGDKDVEVSAPDASEPDVKKFLSHTPVLVDDIISTARTMIETVGHLNNLGMKPAVCIGIHAIFSGDSYEELKRAGVEKIVTTNSVVHETNEIDVSGLFVIQLF